MTGYILPEMAVPDGNRTIDDNITSEMPKFLENVTENGTEAVTAPEADKSPRLPKVAESGRKWLQKAKGANIAENIHQWPKNACVVLHFPASSKVLDIEPRKDQRLCGFRAKNEQCLATRKGVPESMQILLILIGQKNWLVHDYLSLSVGIRCYP